ncbi:MAG TPA: HAD hydrolase-like protein [Pseudonocardia sp.]|nr:HAD hydrolase-like protein [Pseudonocardia sp.]
MTEHIVWDWNGTLFDDALIVYLASCQVFAARGLPSVTEAEYRSAYTRPIEAFYERLFGRKLAEGEFTGFDDAFHDAYRRTMAGVTLTYGARGALRDWRLGGRTQSLLSMFRHEQLTSLVGRYGIKDEFVRIDGLVGPGGGRKAEHLARHLAALRLAPAAVLVVGDSLDDADAATEVGASCVLFNGGYHDRSALEVAGVPIADTMAEVLSLAAAPR